MKRTYYTLSILLLIGIFYSCEDAFTTVKEIKFPEHKKKLAVFSKLSDSTCKIFISHSKSIDDYSDYKKVTANVILQKNGKEFLNFVYPDDLISGNIIIPTVSLPQSINTGDNYTLEVVSEEFGTAKASQTVPQLPVLKDISYEEKYYIEQYDTLNKLEFDIVDPANQENYYYFSIKPTYYKKLKYHFDLFIETEDPIVKESYWESTNGLIVSDKTFDGNSKKISLKIHYNNYPNPDVEPTTLDTILLNIKGITKDYYNFLISKTQFDNSNDNPFAEPVNIYNNIENGYGLFSAETNKTIIIKSN